MTPLIHPQLVNEPFGDPALYLEFMFRKRAMLFDLGDLTPLSSRKLLRVSDVFVSHAHMDHFAGFDRLLRTCLGRDKRLGLYGPPGFIDRVGHRLASYSWNLVQNYTTDFDIRVTEAYSGGETQSAVFRCRDGFAREDEPAGSAPGGILLDEDGFRVRTAFLDHQIPCLAFSLEERRHVNVWKNRLRDIGVDVGPWLREVKDAVLHDAPDDTEIEAAWREGGQTRTRSVRLGDVKRDALRIVPGQKVAYVVDAVYHPDNADKIAQLARDADHLFIEAVFLDEDADKAAQRYHLTAGQAGTLARRAAVRRVTPFHFSPRYEGQAERLRDEVSSAFGAPVANGTIPQST